MTKNDFGVFEVTVPNKDGQPAIPHDSKIKVRRRCFFLFECKPELTEQVSFVTPNDHERQERLPAER